MNTESPSRIANMSAFILTLAILASAVVWFSDGLRQGTYMHSDEFLTLGRSHRFLKFDDWPTVRPSNEVSLKKPQQYRLSAANVLLRIVSPECLRNGRSGLLDSDMACFVLLAILAFFKAHDDGRWWGAAVHPPGAFGCWRHEDARQGRRLPRRCECDKSQVKIEVFSHGCRSRRIRAESAGNR